MALVLADRVKETTDTTGTGTYSLNGAVAGFQSFGDAVQDGNTTYYSCSDSNNFEIGIGTYASSGNTLARTTILKSSNSNNAIYCPVKHGQEMKYQFLEEKILHHTVVPLNQKVRQQILQ